MDEERQRDRSRRAKAALIDTMDPNPARVGNYLYGGRDNFEADRKAVRAMVAVAPIIATIAPATSAFHQRLVRYLAAEAGVRQFLDIGPAFATSGITHRVAQSVDPSCRIVYADSDQMVLSHGRALIKSAPGGVISYLDAEVNEPGQIVAGARATLDFARPVAVLLLSTLGFITDIAEAADVVRSLAGAVPHGSYVAMYHHASDLHPAMKEAALRWNRLSSAPVTLRSRTEVASLVAGLEQVPPGVVPICEWRPAPGDPRFDDVVPFYALVARKP